MGEENKKLVFRELVLDVEKHEVYVRNRKVELTIKEFDLLRCLLSNLGQVVTKETLLETVWGYEFYGNIREIEITVSGIRKKIENDATNPQILMTKRGEGYYIGELKNDKFINNLSEKIPNTKVDYLNKFKYEVAKVGNDSKTKNTESTKIKEYNLNLNKKEQIELWNEQIEIDAKYMQYYKLRKEFNSKKQRVKEYWISNCYIIKTFSRLANVKNNLNEKCINDIKEIIKKLAEKGIYTRSVQSFYNSGFNSIQEAINKISNEYSRLSSIAIRELEKEGFNKAWDIKHSRLNNTIFGQTSAERKETYDNYIQSRKETKKSNIESEIKRMFWSSTYKDVLDGLDKFYDRLMESYVLELSKVNEFIYIPYIHYNKREEIDNMLDNLEIINDKKKIFIEILKINPLEMQAYKCIIENGLFDLEVLNLCKKVYIDEELKNELKNSIKYENNRTNEYINTFALLDNKNSEDIIHQLKDEDDKKKKEEVVKRDKEREENEIREKKEKKEDLINTVVNAIVIVFIIFFILYVINN